MGSDPLSRIPRCATAPGIPVGEAEVCGAGGAARAAPSWARKANYYGPATRRTRRSRSWWHSSAALLPWPSPLCRSAPTPQARSVSLRLRVSSAPSATSAVLESKQQPPLDELLPGEWPLVLRGTAR